jgi:HTH-type transcriptional regulator / antitoxin MqsA
MTEIFLSPETGKPLVRDVRPMEISYKGLSITVDMPGWYGEDPDDSVHEGTDLAVSDTALKQLKIEADKLLAPADVKRIRTKIGLTQQQAGAIIGGGPNAFQKYEAGEVTVSKGISNLLRVLERHPEEIEELKKFARAIRHYQHLIFRLCRSFAVAARTAHEL